MLQSSTIIGLVSVVAAIVLFGIAYGIPFSKEINEEGLVRWPSKTTDTLLLVTYFFGALLCEPAAIAKMDVSQYAMLVLAVGAFAAFIATFLVSVFLPPLKGLLSFLAKFPEDFPKGFKRG